MSTMRLAGRGTLMSVGLRVLICLTLTSWVAVVETRSAFANPQSIAISTDRCPSPLRWWTVPDDGPTFEFTPGVTPEDRDAIRANLSAAMLFLKNATGYEVRNFTVIVSTGNVQEYANHFGITPAEAQQRLTNVGEDCGLLHMVAPPGWRFSGLPIQQMMHGYFHVVQMGLANFVVGPVPRNQVPETGPVWLVEGGAVYAQLAADNGNTGNFYRDQARLACYPLRSLETKEGMYDRIASQTYGLGFWATDSLLRSSSLTLLVSFWDRIGQGVPWESAFQARFGRTVDTFYSEFEAYRHMQRACGGAFAVINSNGTNFRGGQAINLSLTAFNPPGSPSLHLYVGALWPDLNTIAFLSAPNSLGGLGQYSAPASVAPMTIMDAGFLVQDVSILTFTFPINGLSTGTYYVFAAIFRPGSLMDNRLDNGDLVGLHFFPISYLP